MTNTMFPTKPGELEYELCNFLTGETAVLDPDDAPQLARVIVENLLPVFEAAPDLLVVLDFYILGHPCRDKDCPSHAKARQAIAKAQGEA